MAGWGHLATMAAVSRPLTKAVALVQFGHRVRFTGDDDIRNLEQEDRAAVMPNRNPLTNDFT